MPNNIWDNSATIMGDQRGANIGAGIQQAGAAFSQGVQRYFQKKEQDKKEEATVQWLEQSGAANNLFPQLAQIKDPAERTKIIRAGIKGAGLDNMAQVAKFSADQERQKRQDEVTRQLDTARMADFNAQAQERLQRAASAKTEESAVGAAFDPIQESQGAYGARGGYVAAKPAPLAQRDRTPPEMVAAYGRAGGRNPAVMKELNSLTGPEDLTNLQFQEDPVTGERFAVSRKGSVAKSGANPAKPAPQKPGVNAPVLIEVGPRKLFYHPDSKRYFDEQGQPVVFPSSSDAALEDAMNKGLGGATAPAPAAAPAGGLPAPKTKAERDALPSGAQYIGPDGKTYVKK